MREQAEAFLHLAWAESLGTLELLGGVELSNLQVIDRGTYNPHAGPDFLGAKIRIGELLWVGDIEIHHRAEEWYTHRHHEDPAYRAVVLHVVEEGDEPARTIEGRRVLTLRLRIPAELRQRADSLMKTSLPLPCSPLLPSLPETAILPELERLFRERLEHKADAFASLQAETQSWHEALYILLARSLGAGLNGDAMERLARSLPLSALLRQSDRPEQVEALLLGQAGLIDRLEDETYRTTLSREYLFLKTKYSLTPPCDLLWRMARTRPQASPSLRLVQLASLLCSPLFSPTAWARVRELQELNKLLKLTAPSPYWQGVGLPQLGRQSRQLILLNILLPLKFAMGRIEMRSDEALAEAFALASALPSEDNRLVRLFSASGVCPRHAMDGQALVQRYRAYCEARKCFFCSWGRMLFSVPRFGSSAD